LYGWAKKTFNALAEGRRRLNSSLSQEFDWDQVEGTAPR